MTKVHQTADGTPTDNLVIVNGQAVKQVNPGHTKGAFASQGVIETPANVSGWSVQGPSGSNQHLVQVRAPERGEQDEMQAVETPKSEDSPEPEKESERPPKSSGKTSSKKSDKDENNG